MLGTPSGPSVLPVSIASIPARTRDGHRRDADGCGLNGDSDAETEFDPTPAGDTCAWPVILERQAVVTDNLPMRSCNSPVRSSRGIAEAWRGVAEAGYAGMTLMR